MYLIGKDLWELVTGEETLNAAANPEQQRRFRKRENVALATVCLSVETSLQIYVRSAKNAKEAWDNLEQHFERKSLSQKIFYRRKLYSARMGKGAKMIDHINYIKTLAEHLEAVDDEIAEKDLVIILISSLPEEYNYLITALETIAEEKLSWNYVRDRLIHEYDKMQGGSEGTVSTPKAEACQDALFTKKLTEYKKINNCKKFQCHYCKKPGHFARDCFKKKADAKNNPKNVTASMAETKQENGKVNEETATEIALAVGNTPSDKDDWWIDSGASQHMTPVKKGMYGYTPFKKPIEVKLADDTVIFAYGKGELQLVLYDGKDKDLGTRLSPDYRVGCAKDSLITSDFAAAAVLISFGAVLGKVSRFQLLIIGLMEVVFYALNEKLLSHKFHVTDVGGSMVIHAFGAYFGLAVSRIIHNDKLAKENTKEGASYDSDLFAMIGTLFLWLFWPSFNGGLLGPGTQQNRAIINTYFSLSAAVIMTFILSPLLNKENKISMVHVQNASLAGGVAVGTMADLVLNPWGALLVGMIAGALSTCGYAFLTPLLNRKLRIHDTCGVHNLHGMPAIVAAIGGAIAAACADEKAYGKDLYSIWPSRSNVPSTNTTAAVKGRSASAQAGYQLFALIATFAIASVGGIITGFAIAFADQLTEEQYYDDASYWEVPVEAREEQEQEQERLMKSVPPENEDEDAV
eukprot:gene4463-20707_t